MSMEENMKIADAGEQEIEAEFDEAAKEGYELIVLSNNQGVKRGFGDCTYRKCAYIMIIYDSTSLVVSDYAYRNYWNKRPLFVIVPQNEATIWRWRLFSKKRNKIILDSIIYIVNEPVQNEMKTHYSHFELQHNVESVSTFPILWSNKVDIYWLVC